MSERSGNVLTLEATDVSATDDSWLVICLRLLTLRLAVWDDGPEEARRFCAVAAARYRFFRIFDGFVDIWSGMVICASLQRNALPLHDHGPADSLQTVRIALRFNSAAEFGYPPLK